MWPIQKEGHISGTCAGNFSKIQCPFSILDFGRILEAIFAVEVAGDLCFKEVGHITVCGMSGCPWLVPQLHVAGVATHEHSTRGPRIVCPGRARLRRGRYGRQGRDGDAEGTHTTRPVQVVLDTYEVYDIAKKSWLPPQRLGQRSLGLCKVEAWSARLFQRAG